MKVRTLTMKNYGGFADATLDLDRPLTVLFGVNGSGKSSALAALAVALSRVGSGSDGPARWYHFVANTDIRRGAGEVLIAVSVCNEDVVEEISVRQQRLAPGVVEERVAPATHAIGATPILTVFYDASRKVALARDAFDTSGNADEEVPLRLLSATFDSLVAGHLKFRPLFQWFKEREDAENELKVSQEDLTLEDPQLSAVRRAVAGMLPGFSGLRIQRDPLHMVIRKGAETLVVDQLSDGEKLLLALTADLARRLAITWAGHGDPLAGEAVVLIDEVELHLHPSWQRLMLGRLRGTFPNCQFIVTTHSPQVLSEVPNDAVVLVKDFQFVRPGAPTAGRDSNAILAEAMGTPERPATQMAEIRAISALLDEARYDEARSKLDALAREITERDREVVGLRTMLHFLEGGDAPHPQGA